MNKSFQGSENFGVQDPDRWSQRLGFCVHDGRRHTRGAYITRIA